MRAYYAIVHKDPGSAFGVEFPDLPGVFSAADFENDIVANAVEAVRLWAEDEELPAPSPLDTIRQLDKVRAALADGAFIVRIPLIKDDARVVRINVSFEAGILKAIDETAKSRGMTRAAFLASTARKEIETTG